jgi:hypothetical protein
MSPCREDSPDDGAHAGEEVQHGVAAQVEFESKI